MKIPLWAVIPAAGIGRRMGGTTPKQYLRLHGRTVLALTFVDVAPELRHWWLLLSPEEVDVCVDDPGHAVDVALQTPIRTFVRVWRGDIGWREALCRGGMSMLGPEHLRRQVPDWFQLSYFASVPR